MFCLLVAIFIYVVSNGRKRGVVDVRREKVLLVLSFMYLLVTLFEDEFEEDEEACRLLREIRERLKKLLEEVEG